MGWLGTALGAVVGGPAGAVVGGAFDHVLGGKPKHVNPVGVDQKNYVYGGSAGYADRRRAEFERAGTDAQGRSVLAGYSDADYQNAVNAQGESRGRQLALADELENVSAGRGGPSVAEEQMHAGVGQAARNALNVAATSRGGNYANAAVSAQDANQYGAQQAVQDTSLLRAKEIADARAQRGEVLAGVRSGDFSAMQGAIGQEGVAQQEDVLRLRQAEQNDAYQQSLINAELGVNQGELQANMGYGGANLQSGLAAQGYNTAAEQAYQDRIARLWGSVIQAGGSLGASAIKG